MHLRNSMDILSTSLRLVLFAGLLPLPLFSAENTRSLYISNRDPLVPSAFIKLPIGSITPKGWLRHQLDLEAQGMTGHLPEISAWCKIEGNAWVSPTGDGHSGWEEVPYWLKGFGDLGY